MIPKIIHYCWFGPKELGELEKTCLKSWENILPNYKIMSWNEKTFDINSNLYAKQAYESGNYAFVSDYARLVALVKYGGVYFDTDVEVIKKMDKFLENNAFTGFENKTMVAAGIMGCEKDNEFFSKVLEYYNTHAFIDENGNIDATTIVKIMTRILVKHGLEQSHSEQNVYNVHIYDRDVFYPKKMKDGTFRVTDESYTIHRYAGSWLTERERRRGENYFWRKVCRPNLKRIRKLFIAVMGEKKTNEIEASFRKKIR